MAGKDPLRFQDSIQIYTRQTIYAPVSVLDSVSSPAQESNETVTAQLPHNSTNDDFPIALWKDQHNCTQHTVFNFISYSHLLSSFRSFILILTHAQFSRMYQKHCLFQVALRRCRRGDCFRVKWNLGFGHTFIREDSCWALHSQVKPRWVSSCLRKSLVAKGYSMNWIMWIPSLQSRRWHLCGSLCH